jgi:hypothetical protein
VELDERGVSAFAVLARGLEEGDLFVEDARLSEFALVPLAEFGALLGELFTIGNRTTSELSL